ncbi:MAG: c-type cytochrome domain-containing protein, partial [Opitutia bacterium]
MRSAPVLASLLALAAHGADFSHEVVPLLRKHCAECHTGDKKKGGLSMNTRADLLAGSENGAVVRPGDLASRMLAVVVSKDKDERMPPKGPGLSEAEVAKLREWVSGGLVWDEGFAFRKPAYEPPLRPRTPQLPAAADGRAHTVD